MSNHQNLFTFPCRHAKREIRCTTCTTKFVWFMITLEPCLHYKNELENMDGRKAMHVAIAVHGL